MRRIIFFHLVLAGLILNGCASRESTQDNKAAGHPLMTSYMDLKDALYEDDRAKAEIMARNMIRTLESFAPENAAEWQAASEQIRDALNGIAAAKEIGEQRVHFEKLSDALYENAQKFGLVTAAVYRQYCPMAFDFKGAYWLNDKEKIENPYFGAEMPQCGEVKDTLEVK